MNTLVPIQLERDRNLSSEFFNNFIRTKEKISGKKKAEEG